MANSIHPLLILPFETKNIFVTGKTDPGRKLKGVLMSDDYLCASCKMREVSQKGVDRSKPAITHRNPVDKLTSTVSWPSISGKYCYFCDKKHDGLIKL
jgi:hypothetical protein